MTVVFGGIGRGGVVPDVRARAALTPATCARAALHGGRAIPRVAGECAARRRIAAGNGARSAAHAGAMAAPRHAA